MSENKGELFAGPTMVYKGFAGSVEISMEDNCLFGKIINTRHLVNYEGQTLRELNFAFKEAVDDLNKELSHVRQTED